MGVDDYKVHAAEEAEMQRFETSLRSIALELIRIDAEYKIGLKAIKGRFNVFSLLRDAGDESGLHTRWLAYARRRLSNISSSSAIGGAIARQ